MKNVSLFILVLLFGILQGNVQSAAKHSKCSKNVTLEEWLNVAKKLFYYRTPVTLTLEPAVGYENKKHLIVDTGSASPPLESSIFEAPESVLNFIHSYSNKIVDKQIPIENRGPFNVSFKIYKKNRAMSEVTQTEGSSGGNENIENAECVKKIEVAEITYGKSHIYKDEHISVEDVLCVEFENRVGTGYIWALVGVNDRKTEIDIASLPYEYKKNVHSSSSIIVTPPKKEEAKQNPMMNYDHSHGQPLLGGLVGGAVPMFSKIKPLKSGEYFVTYAMFRPFNPQDAPNIRTIHVIVH